MTQALKFHAACREKEAREKGRVKESDSKRPSGCSIQGLRPVPHRLHNEWLGCFVSPPSLQAVLWQTPTYSRVFPNVRMVLGLQFGMLAMRAGTHFTNDCWNNYQANDLSLSVCLSVCLSICLFVCLSCPVLSCPVVFSPILF